MTLLWGLVSRCRDAVDAFGEYRPLGMVPAAGTETPTAVLCVKTIESIERMAAKRAVVFMDSAQI